MLFPVTATPGSVPRNSARPPTGSGNPAPPPGAAVRPADSVPLTLVPRPIVEPVMWMRQSTGFPTQHPYVRKFWTAAIGSGAVADLMRLAVAAQRGRSLPLPSTVNLLSREGLVSWSGGRLLTSALVPPLPDHHVRRMTPSLRREHSTAVGDLRSTA